MEHPAHVCRPAARPRGRHLSLTASPASADAVRHEVSALRRQARAEGDQRPSGAPRPTPLRPGPPGSERPTGRWSGRPGVPMPTRAAGACSRAVPQIRDGPGAGRQATREAQHALLLLHVRQGPARGHRAGWCAQPDAAHRANPDASHCASPGVPSPGGRQEPTAARGLRLWDCPAKYCVPAKCCACGSPRAKTTARTRGHTRPPARPPAHTLALTLTHRPCTSQRTWAAPSRPRRAGWARNPIGTGARRPLCAHRVRVWVRLRG